MNAIWKLCSPLIESKCQVRKSHANYIHFRFAALHARLHTSTREYYDYDTIHSTGEYATARTHWPHNGLGEMMTKALLFTCCCAILFCLTLMAEDKSVLALGNDAGEPRIGRYFEGGQFVRVKRACGTARCSYTRQCDSCCACVEGFCCPITR
uniref:Uncharacterized protein n=1 Tax=Globodera rostochiensis TaxID=31243 RepID=A0A914I409_GLORO